MAGNDAWPSCNVTRSALEARVEGGLLHPITGEGVPEWIAPQVSDREPNPPPVYVVCFLSFLEWGFGTPTGRLIRAILHYYGVELHNLNPNSVTQVKALVWFWIIDETLVLTSILSLCRLNEVGTCQVMKQVMIMVMKVMTTR